MKNIYADKISAVVADAENANFPIANIQDDHPKNLYKHTGTTAIITATVSSGAAALALFNTNATAATVVIALGMDIDLEDGLTLESGLTVETDESVSTLYDLSGSTGRLWGTYTQIDVVHYAEITLTGTAIIEAGKLTIGALNTFTDPLPGVKESPVDYSIKKQLNSGAWYFRKRDVVRDFKLRVPVQRNNSWSSDFYDLVYNIYEQIGPQPIAWHLVSDQGDWEWVGFLSIQQLIGYHDLPEYSFVDIDFLEVV